MDKLPQSVYRFHLLNATGSRKVPEIKDFRGYFPSTLDIKHTVSTWHEETILLSKNSRLSIIPRLGTYRQCEFMGTCLLNGFIKVINFLFEL
ncbi:MAG: hypothetical protein IIZ78_02470, partial [Clostridiales bacterium]|nr:hypothetical protein [Clostridiales bacterium]